MKFLLPLVLCLLTVPALAQRDPKSEFFAGYSYVRTAEESVEIIPGTTGTQQAANLNGFNFSISYNPAPWIGIVGDVGGYYGIQNFRIVAPAGTLTVGARTQVYSVFFGPQFSARGRRVTVFGRPLVGFVHGSQSATIGGQAASTSDTVFAFGGGAGVDVHLGERVSLRALQGDVIWTRFSGATQANLRISTGFVFRNKD